jgi:GxxExxY protein
MHVEEIASIAVDCGLKLHKDVGPGLLESAYENMLAYLLERRGLRVERQVMIPIKYEGLSIEQGFRADLIVDKKLLIELKSVERLLPIHRMQVVTYLRFLNLSVGLLMNFSSEQFKTGLMRVVNNHADIKGSTLRMHQ